MFEFLRRNRFQDELLFGGNHGRHTVIRGSQGRGRSSRLVFHTKFGRQDGHLASEGFAHSSPTLEVDAVLLELVDHAVWKNRPRRLPRRKSQLGLLAVHGSWESWSSFRPRIPPPWVISVADDTRYFKQTLGTSISRRLNRYITYVVSHSKSRLSNRPQLRPSDAQ